MSGEDLKSQKSTERQSYWLKVIAEKVKQQQQQQQQTP